jgi:hypothetical protein
LLHFPKVQLSLLAVKRLSWRKSPCLLILCGLELVVLCTFGVKLAGKGLSGVTWRRAVVQVTECGLGLPGVVY